MGPSTWRSLNSVMLVTLHVAVIASIFRALGQPTTLTGSIVIWVPLSILVGAFLSWPMGRALSAAFHPETESSVGHCRRCGGPELRPLLRAGGGIFQPVAGYRCARCGTTHRLAESGLILERPPVGPDMAESSGIVFLVEVPPPGHPDEIRFLDDKPGDPAGPTNILAGPVSGD